MRDSFHLGYCEAFPTAANGSHEKTSKVFPPLALKRFGHVPHNWPKENHMANTNKNSATVDLKPNNSLEVNKEAAKGKILQAAMDHLQAIGIARSHFGLHFDLVWEE
jgi:hypothetical protein